MNPQLPQAEPHDDHDTDVVFAPQFGVHDVDELTLGRASFNDSDKSNYFEG